MEYESDPPDERAYVERACRGDGHALSWIRASYAPAVHALLLARVPPGEAGRLVEDVFRRMGENMDAAASAPALGPWILDLARGQAATMADGGGLSGNAGRALETLRSLPDVFRDPLLMRFVEGMTGPDIAHATGTDPDRVRTALVKGVGLLGERMGRAVGATDEGYVWSGTGVPCREVSRFEAALRPYGYAEPKKRRWGLYGVIACAVVAFVLLGGVILLITRSGNDTAHWSVITQRGVSHDTETLVLGGYMSSGPDEKGRIPVGDMGHVDLEPETRIGYLRADAEEHRLDLQHGTIQVHVAAPPPRFVVDTPAATVVGLGGAWTLQVAEDGSGLLQVHDGEVEIQGDGRPVRVPGSASCRIRPGEGPGVPWFEGAPEELIDVRLEDDAPLTAAMTALRPEDTLTLWHLLPRVVDDDARLMIAVRLTELVSLPEDVSLDAVVALDEKALAAWEKALRTHW